MQNLIERIKERDPMAMRQVVAKHQRLLYSLALSQVDREKADDVVQATWEKAIKKIHQLNDETKFTPWLCRICRNSIYEVHRSEGPVTEEWEEEFYHHWEERESLYERYDGLVRLALRMLPENQREVVQLRFFSGLSYSEISMVCGIDEQLVKSRLFEAKKKLKIHLSELYDGLEVSQQKLDQTEELIMNEFERSTLGANVFCRLSLDTQMKFTITVKEKKELPPEILSEIGMTRQGTKFIAAYHKTILLPELVNILNTVDRYTEARLVLGLEEVDPVASEMIKENMFVFEDCVLLSEKTRKKLFELADPKLLQMSMSIVSQKVKEMLLVDFTEDDKKEWYRSMGEVDADIDVLQKAQRNVIEILKEMDNRGELEIVGIPQGDATHQSDRVNGF